MPTPLSARCDVQFQRYLSEHELPSNVQYHNGPVSTALRLVKDTGPGNALELTPNHLITMLHIGKDFKSLLHALEDFVPKTYPVEGIPRHEVPLRVLLGHTTTSADEIARNNYSWNLLQRQAAFLGDLVPQSGNLPIPDNTSTQTQRLEHIQAALVEYMSANVEETAMMNAVAKAEGLFGKDMYQANSSFICAVGEHSAGRKIGFTRRGHMVLVPPGRREGDEIHYIAYGETSFVLQAAGEEADVETIKERGKEEDGSAREVETHGKFELLGDCYVYGVEFEDVLGVGDGLRRIAIV